MTVETEALYRSSLNPLDAMAKVTITKGLVLLNAALSLAIFLALQAYLTSLDQHDSLEEERSFISTPATKSKSNHVVLASELHIEVESLINYTMILLHYNLGSIMQF